MARQPLGIVFKRAVRLRCPRCGKGPLFAAYFRMYERCANCNLKFERAPGYYLGSTYINYGLTAMLLTGLYIGLHFGLEYSNRALTLPLTAVCVLVPVVFFRYARALWLAMDSVLDSTGFESDDG